MQGIVRFGVVGCGVIGPKHAGILNELECAELVAVADVVKARADRLAEKYGVDACYTLDALLEREDIDCLSICTPSGMHGDMAIAAMKAGKGVIVEKPIDISLDKIDHMIAISEETGQMLAAIFNYRFNAASLQLKQAVEQGQLGRLVLGDAYVKWYRSQEYYDSGDWRGTWELDGGGSLMNQSVHFIDMLQWIMGPVQSLSANVATLAHERVAVEDVSTVTLKFQNGALGVIEGSTAIVPGQPGRIEVHGTKGTIVLEEDKIVRWDVQGARPEDVHGKSHDGARSNPSALSLEGHAAQIADTAAAWLRGDPPTVGGREARAAVAIIQSIYRAAETRAEVQLVSGK